MCDNGDTNSRHLGLTCQVVVTVFYSVGIVGNILALYTLFRSEHKCNKSILMLRYLAVNDLVALMGMLILMNLQLTYPDFAHNYWFCILRVIWRAFGLGSGCVAIVMAIERWLALTKPFLFKKYVTYKVINRSIFLLWLSAAILTYLPVAGFGLFFNKTCVRYRCATDPKDIAYAYIYFMFGTMLSACIVWCNLGVIQELARVGKRVSVRRINRSFSRSNSVTHCNPTAEELAFAKLMAILCILFVICWMPQMISIPMAQFLPPSNFRKKFFRIADILMAVHFTIDPYVYVLLRFKRNRTQKNDPALHPLSTGTSN